MANEPSDFETDLITGEEDEVKESLDDFLADWPIVAMVSDMGLPLNMDMDILGDTPLEPKSEIMLDEVMVNGCSEQVERKTRVRKTKYGTGIEAQRTREHKNKEYKALPFFNALLERYGRVSMKLLKEMARILETEGFRINRDAKRLKPWLVEVLSNHIPVDRIGEYVPSEAVVNVRDCHW